MFKKFINQKALVFFSPSYHEEFSPKISGRIIEIDGEGIESEIKASNSMEIKDIFEEQLEISEINNLPSYGIKIWEGEILFDHGEVHFLNYQFRDLTDSEWTKIYHNENLWQKNKD